MVKILAGLLLVVLLTGCAAQRAYNDGQKMLNSGKVEEGLAQLEAAYKLDPDNSEYRSQYFRRREIAVFQLLAQAEAAKKTNAWDEAEGYYRRILKIDPDNHRGKVGLSALDTEKRQKQILDEAAVQLNNNELNDASKKVRQVLSESPSNTEALRLQKAIEAKIVSSSNTRTVLKSKLERPITIDFKDAQIRAVFDSISSVSGINFLFDKEVRADLRTSLFVRDARIEDVIRFVLFTNQLDQRVLNSNTLFIYPNTNQKQKDYQELQVRNFYLTNANAKDVAAVLKGMVKTQDVFVDEKLNLIVMRDTPQVIGVAERLIAAQDIAEPEVMLEVEILEAGTNLLDTLGIQYPSQISASVVGAAGTPGSLTLPEAINFNKGMVRLSFNDPALIVNLLHQDGDTNLLANPRIRVKNHEKADIHIGDKVPVITNTTTATGLVSQSINYLDVGLKLDVEPTIYLDNDVGIKVGLEVSSITKQVPSSNGTLAYQLGTRKANTVLRLKDGETQILAGLIDKEERKNANGIPVLGQLPILGRLFSSHSDSSTKTEVVLLITPHVVRNIIPPESPVEAFLSGTNGAMGLDQLELKQVNTVGANTGKTEKIANVAKDAVESATASPERQASLSPTTDAKNKLMLEVPAQIKGGKEFTAKINLSSENLQNVLLNLSYDPTKLKVTGVNQGSLLKTLGGKAKFLHQIQDQAGRVSLSIIQQERAPGEGELAGIQFQAMPSALGVTQLRIEAAIFSDALGRMQPLDELPVATMEIGK